ncbi:MAG TPA: response regulator [Nitrospira sp.]
MDFPPSILLIDGYQDDRLLLHRSLREAGRDFQLYQASDGKTGLDLFRTVEPDCVVMELKLSDMIGMELLNLMKIGTEKPIPIFIWTRLNHAMLRSTASTLGVSGYFEKTQGSESQVTRAILDAFAAR